MTTCLHLPWPPSTNGYWRAFRGRQILSKKGREYKKRIRAEFQISEPLVGDLAIEMILYPPDRKRRDCDNYLKATLDAMTHVGLWVDDSQIKDMRIVMCSPERPGRICLTVNRIHFAEPESGDRPCVEL